MRKKSNKAYVYKYYKMVKRIKSYLYTCTNIDGSNQDIFVELVLKQALSIQGTPMIYYAKKNEKLPFFYVDENFGRWAFYK